MPKPGPKPWSPGRAGADEAALRKGGEVRTWMVYFHTRGFRKPSSLRVEARTAQAAENKALRIARSQCENPVGPCWAVEVE